MQKKYIVTGTVIGFTVGLGLPFLLFLNRKLDLGLRFTPEEEAEDASAFFGAPEGSQDCTVLGGGTSV